MVWTVVLVCSALAYVPVAVLLVAVFDEPWWRGLPQFGGTGLGVGLVTWWRDRGHGLSEEERRRALREGRLPPEADTQAWRRALHQDEQVQVWAGWVLLVLLPLVLVCAIVLTITVDLGIVGWAVVGTTVLSSAALWLARRRTVERLDVLLRQLPPG